MRDRSQRVSSLLASIDSRASYIRSKLSILVPSQIRSLRLKSNMPRQADLAAEAKMQQSRISMFETPGAANLTLDTLSRLAAAFKVGLVVKFVPFSEMLRWENNYSQDAFDVNKIDSDIEFLNPDVSSVRNAATSETSIKSVRQIAENFSQEGFNNPQEANGGLLDAGKNEAAARSRDGRNQTAA